MALKSKELLRWLSVWSPGHDWSPYVRLGFAAARCGTCWATVTAAGTVIVRNGVVLGPKPVRGRALNVSVFRSSPSRLRDEVVGALPRTCGHVVVTAVMSS